MTAGNVITWVTTVGTIIYVYGQLSANVDNMRNELQRMQNTDIALQRQIDVMRDLNTVRQIDISTKMTRLETILERMEGKADRAMNAPMRTPQP